LEFKQSIRGATNLSQPVLGIAEPTSDLHLTIAFAALAVILFVMGVWSNRKK